MKGASPLGENPRALTVDNILYSLIINFKSVLNQSELVSSSPTVIVVVTVPSSCILNFFHLDKLWSVDLQDKEFVSLVYFLHTFQVSTDEFIIDD